MTHVATLHYTDSLVREAVLCFWKRSIGWKFPIAMVLGTAGLFLTFLSGDRSWFVGAAAAALFFCLAFAVLIYIVHLRNSLAKFRALKEPIATFTAEEATFTATSDQGSSTLVWSAVHEIWQFERCWLLLMSRAQFVTLPLSDVPPDMRRYILERVSASRSPHVG